MSASKQKRIRNELRTEGPNKKELAQQEAEVKSKKFKRNTIITIMVFVIVLAAALFINSDYLYTKTTAVDINGTSYSPTEFNYYYRVAYSNLYNDYSSYISLLIDSSTPLDEQPCMFSDQEDYTWADYLSDSALTSLTQVTALYDAAVAAGHEPTEEELAAIDSNLEEYAATGSSYGYENLDGYLVAIYGKGMNEEQYRAIMTKYVVAASYGQAMLDSYSYTEDELDAYYAENLADSYDRISYHVYYVGTSNSDFENLADDDAKAAAAHERAAAIADASTGEEFADNLYETLSDDDKELFQGEEYTLTDNWTDSMFSSYSEWLLDTERKTGDSTVIDTDTGSYALLYIDRDNNDYNMVDFRHILCEIELDENGEYTEEAKDTALAKANMLLSMYNGDPTEETFASLAMLNSDDTSSAESGGKYTNVYKGTMVDGVEEFCFAEGREVGDVAIVFGENPGAYAGYHIMYYVGKGQAFADYLAESNMKSDDYNAYIEELTADYTAVTKSGMKFANLS